MKRIKRTSDYCLFELDDGEDILDTETVYNVTNKFHEENPDVKIIVLPKGLNFRFINKEQIKEIIQSLQTMLEME